ncbi:MAG: hypothetical protein UT33_C0011G0013 [Candidatus Peregrinibacteria bacterium GW2011_GWC2_39_14]|nr:MAG: hypothetical protein UT33_C0011G0013 [Candidatus Peregrinibacteria bacterium GW2011_GWC2_39_14]
MGFFNERRFKREAETALDEVMGEIADGIVGGNGVEDDKLKALIDRRNLELLCMGDVSMVKNATEFREFDFDPDKISGLLVRIVDRVRGVLYLGRVAKHLETGRFFIGIAISRVSDGVNGRVEKIYS